MAVSTAYVNQILPKDAAGVHIPGHVIQVVNAYSSVQSITSSTTYADALPVASIVPTNTQNKVLVILSADTYLESATNSSPEMDVRIMRNSVEIKEFRRARQIRATAYSGILGEGGQSTFVFLDSPQTTSNVTYMAQIKSSDTNTNVRFNKDNLPTTTITLMEIAQ